MFFEVIELPFMRRALLAALLMGWLAGWLGSFVVQRGLSFLGNGLAHAAFGGVAIALFLEAEPLWVALPFTAMVAAGIALLENRTSIRGDTAIGIFFSLAVAIGIVVLSFRRSFTADAMSYLFGSILTVQNEDLIAAAILSILLVALLPLWGRWAYAGADRELARADRVPVDRDNLILALFVSAVVVVSIKLVGMILLTAFLVIPAAAGRLFARRFRTMTLLSLLFACSSAVGGLLLSWQLDLPTGATIILVQSLLFFTALGYNSLKGEAAG